ncbi:MAG TPA: HD domain-containing protein [Gemmatimonadales bacterium]|nr:HD domain-containing protein [Gemmatimonadales bacterium]
MTHCPLRDLSIGARVQGPFIVTDVEVRGGDTPHTILTFGDRTGRLESAPFWPSDATKVAGISRGDVVQVTGTVGSYRDRRQLVVASIRVLSRDQVDWRALMPSVGDVDRYWKVLDRWRSDIRGPRLVRTLGLFFDDPDFRARFEQCPASPHGHHAALGGLLKHTCEVGHIALAIARLHSAADLALLLAGVLLHDIGKVECYRWDAAFDVTVPGFVLGHVACGALLLDRRARALEPMPCTETELLALLHLVLSHHGRLEFGAPVAPMTLEAEILHYADNASAKAASLDQALQDPENFVPGSPITARPLWQLEKRRLWRQASDWGAEGTHASPGDFTATAGQSETAAGLGGPAAASHLVAQPGWPS